MVWSIFEYEHPFVETDKIVVSGIPTLIFKPTNMKTSTPTVIYYHGWHSSKEFKKFEAMTLASFGFQVVVPDALYHGDRDPIDHDDPEMKKKYLWKIILNTIEESTNFLHDLITDYKTNPDKIGIMGSSMGGFSASGVFIKNKEIKCLVNLKGTCALTRAEKLFAENGGITPLTDDRQDKLEMYDPMLQKEKIKKRPILMLHGDQDKSVPIKLQRDFYKDVFSYYENEEERLKLIEGSGMGHCINTGMYEKAVNWFKRYL